MPETTPLSFRLAGEADIDAVVALVESAYRGEVSRRGWTTEADLLDGRRTGRDEIEALMRAPGSDFLLAERGGEAVASAHVQRCGEHAWFGMFAVRPTLQGSGVGRALLVEAERLARVEWSCSEMRMTVISVREELIAWYLRRGYRRTGQYEPFPYGDERFGIPRRDDLKFELLVKPLEAG
ncbi:MAG TPA: GNAT family N-acetyltransferase [Xanthomonadaceae bacterium]|nr:GNAT family N-acetyltransferase [Xanthomonadaceae bacterium]